MDKSTFVGLILANLAMLFAIVQAGASLQSFWDVPSLVVVLGGVIAAAMMAFPGRALRELAGLVRKALFPETTPLSTVIGRIVGYAEIARRDGLLALEKEAETVRDPYLLLGLHLAIDGTDSETLESILRAEMEALSARHRQGRQLLESLARYAPAFGMIGTLIGLVIMLGKMSTPDAIGPGMAVALLTTLYGAYLANAVFLPLSEKLAYYSRLELQGREVILRGLVAIQEGDNPRLIEQKLQTFLPAHERIPFTRRRLAA